MMKQLKNLKSFMNKNVFYLFNYKINLYFK